MEPERKESSVSEWKKRDRSLSSSSELSSLYKSVDGDDESKSVDDSTSDVHMSGEEDEAQGSDLLGDMMLGPSNLRVVSDSTDYDYTVLGGSGGTAEEREIVNRVSNLMADFRDADGLESLRWALISLLRDPDSNEDSVQKVFTTPSQRSVVACFLKRIQSLIRDLNKLIYPSAQGFQSLQIRKTASELAKFLKTQKEKEESMAEEEIDWEPENLSEGETDSNLSDDILESSATDVEESEDMLESEISEVSLSATMDDASEDEESDFEESVAVDPSLFTVVSKKQIHRLSHSTSSESVSEQSKQRPFLKPGEVVAATAVTDECESVEIDSDQVQDLKYPKSDGKKVEPVPGEIRTEPDRLIVFNAPFSERNVYHFRLVNMSKDRLGWAMKTNRMGRLNVNPGYGVLKPGQQRMLTVSCEPLGPKDRKEGDRLSIVWMFADSDQFKREWLEAEGISKRKNIRVLFNP